MLQDIAQYVLGIVLAFRTLLRFIARTFYLYPTGASVIRMDLLK